MASSMRAILALRAAAADCVLRAWKRQPIPVSLAAAAFVAAAICKRLCVCPNSYTER
jgi:hypothetical protein